MNKNALENPWLGRSTWLLLEHRTAMMQKIQEAKEHCLL